MSCLQGKLWIVLERRDSVDAVGGWNINKITHRMTVAHPSVWMVLERRDSVDSVDAVDGRK